MKKTQQIPSLAGKTLPIVVQRGEDGYYVVECPVISGCYSQGKTLDEAMKNIREVIELLLEEAEVQESLADYSATELSLHTITL